MPFLFSSFFLPFPPQTARDRRSKSVKTAAKSSTSVSSSPALSRKQSHMSDATKTLITASDNANVDDFFGGAGGGGGGGGGGGDNVVGNNAFSANDDGAW